MEKRSTSDYVRNSSWIDITLTLRDGMPGWPGDPVVRINRVVEIERGDRYNLSSLSLGSHTGTHVDAPAHYLPDGPGVDKMPLNIGCGEGRVIQIANDELIETNELIRHNIGPGERILFKTQNSTLWKTEKFAERFVHLSTEAARYLAERGVSLIGIDYLSIGGYEPEEADVHRLLLGAGIWIIEGLDLSEVLPGDYEIVCLPLKIWNGDGAPARVIIRPLVKN